MAAGVELDYGLSMVMHRGVISLLSLLGLPVALYGCEDSEHTDDHGEHDHVADAGDHDGGDHEEDIGPASGATCPSDSTLTYENFGKPFFETHCTRCHSSELTGDARNGAPLEHDFDSYNGILVVAHHIDQYAAAGDESVNTTMPKSGTKPTDAERKKLGEWLACEFLVSGDE